MALSPGENRALAPLIRLVEDERERGFEPVGDFRVVRTERKIGRNDRDHRGDEVSGYGPIALDRSHQLDCGGRDAELLPGLANGGVGAALARIETTARKRDLAGMSAQMLAPDR